MIKIIEVIALVYLGHVWDTVGGRGFCLRGGFRPDTVKEGRVVVS